MDLAVGNTRDMGGVVQTRLPKVHQFWPFLRFIACLAVDIFGRNRGGEPFSEITGGCLVVRLEGPGLQGYESQLARISGHHVTN